jgi:quercetin dioxygenase-like cupin family protein
MSLDPHVVWMPGGVPVEIHLSGEQTEGAFCMLVDHPPVGWSLPPHRHRDAAETIHIIEGDFEMVLGGQPLRQSAGQTIHVPRGVIHSGANVGARPGRRAVIFSPAGMEDLFLEVGVRRAEDQIDPAVALAAATRHGWEFITEAPD